MSSPPATSNTAPTLLAWLRLFRAPNFFTAIADIAMGFLVVLRDSFEPFGLFVCLATSSALLYTAGMVLNDVFDFDVDAKERPFRPLPAGQIPLPLARTIGFVMLVAGVLFGGMAGFLYATALPWRSGVISLALAGSVLLYDGWLKRLPVGPLGMGLCRFLNVLLGMSIGPNAGGYLLGYEASYLLPAAGIGVYIIGVTIFAKGEASQSLVGPLVAGMCVMAAGVALLGWAGHFVGRKELSLPIYLLLLAVLLATLLRRCLAAVLEPTPGHVQAGVKSAIVSLILFDAAVALAAAPPIYSLGIVLLLVPMVVLGRWVYST